MSVDIDRAVELYNANTDSVPGPLQGVVASNTTELQIQKAQQKYYTLETDGSMNITDVTVGETDTPDVIVKTDRDTACALYTASNPVNAFNTAYSNDEITVEANGVVNQAKIFVVEKVVEVLNIL
jgi:hypothetical protein